MLNTIQITGQVQPQTAMIQDETYELGEVVLPRADGQWTLFAANRIFTKDDGAFSMGDDLTPGRNAPYPVQVTWLAADDVAFQITYQRYVKEAQEAERRQNQQLIKPATPQLLV